MDSNAMVEMDWSDVAVNLNGVVFVDETDDTIDLDECENIARELIEKGQSALKAIAKLRKMVAIAKE